MTETYMQALSSLPENAANWRKGWACSRCTTIDLSATPLAGLGWSRQETQPKPSSDDADWIASIQQGDEEAASDLVRRLYPTVIKSVRCHLPQRTSEEDLVQAIFIKVFKKLDQFSGLVPLEHWVSRIAVNTCINQLKHEAIRPELRMGDLSEEQERVIQHLISTDEDLPETQGSSARELVEKMLVRLKPAERLIITLLHLEERSTEEVSRLTGWSISLVKVRAFRARRKMHQIWKTFLSHEVA
jgi:RNA polymerase sigma-70 factor, ECF subfamily